MPGQATVIIGESTWTVSVASSAAEMVAGLSGVASLPANTGILFDMGIAQHYISINMADMLFSLDIVFISSVGEVIGVLHDVGPGEAVTFNAGTGPGAKYFMEVNAGEMVDVSAGDTVTMEGVAVTDGAINLDQIINLMVTVMIIGMMMKAMGGTLKTPVKKPLIYGPKGEILT